MPYTPDLSDIFVQAGVPARVASDLEARLVAKDPVSGVYTDPAIQAMVSGAGNVGIRVPSLARGVLSSMRTRIVSATDAVSNDQLDALQDPLDRLMRSSAYAKLKVLWVPVGNSALTGAMVPLIGANFTPVSLVAGDYSDTVGITGDGTAKTINTNFNPTTAAVSAADWGFGAFSQSAAANGIIVGTGASVNSYVGFASSGAQINNISGGAALSLSGFNAIQMSGGNITTWTGGCIQATTPAAAGTRPNDNLHILKAHTFFSNQQFCGFAAWTPGLTKEEMCDLDTFFRSANLALWRNTSRPTLLTCGDSNTGGFGLVSPTVTRYSALASAALGLTEDNQGKNGYAMSSANTGAAGNFVVGEQVRAAGGRAPGVLTVMLGTNDSAYSVSTESFAADYELWLTNQISAGIHPSQIILMTPPATTIGTTPDDELVAFSGVVRGLAAKHQTGLLDVYALTKNVSGILQGDLIHLNEAGHTLIANALVSYIRAGKPTGFVRQLASY